MKLDEIRSKLEETQINFVPAGKPKINIKFDKNQTKISIISALKN
jgi:hypothetical protein